MAAFFVAQRVKRSQPVIEKVRFTKYVSPNGDGIRDWSDITFRVRRTDRADVSLVDREGDPVRTLATDRRLCGPCTHGFRWGGWTDGGARAPDGAYRLRVVLREQGRAVTSPRKLFVDTKPPRPLIRSVNPDSISPDGDGYADSALIRFDGPTGLAGERRPPKFLIYRLSRRGGTPVIVTGFDGRRGHSQARWSGRIAHHAAAPGRYLVVVRVRDAAGNLGRSRARLPARPGEHPELRVSYIEGSRLFGTTVPRARIAFAVRTDRPAYRWTLRRLGAASPARHGRARARRLLLKAPRRPARYQLILRAGAHRDRVLFTVRKWKR